MTDLLSSWDAQRISELREYLVSLSDGEYKAFNDRIINTSRTTYGVRIPQLRKIAREIAKGDYASFIEEADDDAYEMNLLKGLVIARAKCGVDTIDAFLGTYDNWTVNDVVCGDIKRSDDEYYDFLVRQLSADNKWRVRFGVTGLMNNYMRGDDVGKILRVVEGARSQEEYYVAMAIAWLVSVAYVRDKEETERFLDDCKFGEFILRKSVSKICDSYRVQREDKARMRSWLKDRLTR